MTISSLLDKKAINIPRPTGRRNTISPSYVYVRNPSWLTLPSVGTSDQKFVGLMAVFPDAAGGEPSNFLAISATGNYTIDWGDGVIENYNTGVIAYHVYDFTDTDLANTNAPVTLTDSGDKIERTAHGYTNGMTVQFYNIVSTTGITEGQTYYVINANANDFQISTTENGSAVVLTTNGSATLLRYKQAIVTITPQAGQNLTNINLQRKHNQTNLQTYDSNWLDIRLGSPNLSSLTISSSSLTVLNSLLEQVELVNTGAITNFSNLFLNCRGLKNVIIGTIGSITTTDNMFENCINLISAPFFEASSVTAMNFMFSGCTKLTFIPLFNTANVLSMSSIFASCTSLTSVPLFNTGKVTNMSNMFSGCTSLTFVPFFNTVSVTSMYAMFYNCYSLTSVPLFNTANVTSMQLMFGNCYSLINVPLFNTVKVTNMVGMFSSCRALTTVPLFDTANVTNMQQMFSSCISLITVPLFNTSKVSNMQQMFNLCTSLTSVPLFDTTTVTSMESMFNSCSSLTSVPLFNIPNITTTNSMFSSCYSLVNVPPFIKLGGIGSSFVSNCTSLNYFPAIDLNITLTFSNAFQNCSSLANIDAYGSTVTHSISNCKLSKTALKKYMDNLGRGSIVTPPTLTISSNWGIGTNATKTVTSTAQSTTVSCSDTSNLSVGMMMTGTGTGINGVSVTSDITADTLTLNSHGLSNGTRISFSALGTTTGVITNVIYYVVNAATNTFQIALTAGGAAIDLTGSNATMTMRYPNYISSINPNVSVTLDLPAASSQTNAIWIFRTVDSYGALLKGWAVTY